MRVQIRAYFPMPNSWSRAKKGLALSGDIRPGKKPDVDNIIKIVLDGLNGIAYDDDKQVVYASCKKMYGTAGEIWVSVEEDKV